MVAESQPGARTRDPHAIGPHRPLVMVVDDQDDVLTMHREFLGLSGFDTCGTSTAMHAIEMAITERPDVILTDLRMPFVDGWTIVRTLKEHPLTAHIPIVVLTGDPDALHSERADAANCSALLTKPCPPQLMADTLRSVLGVPTHAIAEA